MPIAHLPRFMSSRPLTPAICWISIRIAGQLVTTGRETAQVEIKMLLYFILAQEMQPPSIFSIVILIPVQSGLIQEETPTSMVVMLASAQVLLLRS